MVTIEQSREFRDAFDKKHPRSDGDYVHLIPYVYTTEVCLDGDFTLEELKTLVELMSKVQS